MADMRNAFGTSAYLGAKDLKGEITVTISGVDTEQVRGDNGLEDKWVVSFHSANKKLILNVTNTNILIDALGYESNDWIGQQVVLFTQMVQYNGRSVPGLRVRVDTPIQQAQDEVQQQAQQQHQPVAAEDIPF
tara:strand:+ start:870 stop:1268 length:399 start_codon:yes stop_codon:yes gene_type:complete